MDNDSPSFAQDSSIAVRNMPDEMNTDHIHPPPSPTAILKLPEGDLSERKEVKLIESPFKVKSFPFNLSTQILCT